MNRSIYSIPLPCGFYLPLLESFLEPKTFEMNTIPLTRFIEWALIKDPCERPSTPELLAHPWIQSWVRWLEDPSLMRPDEAEKRRVALKVCMQGRVDRARKLVMDDVQRKPRAAQQVQS
jgi:serine/threonine protein kinase